jgi:hypothetical protein
MMRIVFLSILYCVYLFLIDFFDNNGSNFVSWMFSDINEFIAAKWWIVLDQL